MVRTELPSGMPPDIWESIELTGSTRDFYEDEPHPPMIKAIPCSGNLFAGNEREHVWLVIAEIWVWIPKTEYGWGQWKTENEVPLTEWIPKTDILTQYIFGEREYHTIFTDSHSSCDDCAAARN